MIKSLWTLIMMLLLAILPAGVSWASEAGPAASSPCAKCCCCTQPQNAARPAASSPLSAPGRAVSAERFASEIDSTRALPSPSPLDALSVPAAAQQGFVALATGPLFERYCSRLI